MSALCALITQSKDPYKLLTLQIRFREFAPCFEIMRGTPYDSNFGMIL